MSTSRSYMHDCALTLPVVVGGAWLVGGGAFASATLVAGLAVLVNLAVSERVVSRFVRAAALGGDAGAVGGLVFKQLTVLPLAVVLMASVGALAVAVAMSCLLWGTLLHAATGMLQHADAAGLAPARLTLQESGC